MPRAFQARSSELVGLNCFAWRCHDAGDAPPSERCVSDWR